jgi:hypothetical protein
MLQLIQATGLLVGQPWNMSWSPSRPAVPLNGIRRSIFGCYTFPGLGPTAANP